jgi:hypothetical protein
LVLASALQGFLFGAGMFGYFSALTGFQAERLNAVVGGLGGLWFGAAMYAYNSYNARRRRRAPDR